jgi:hypothetical protein
LAGAVAGGVVAGAGAVAGGVVAGGVVVAGGAVVVAAGGVVAVGVGGVLRYAPLHAQAITMMTMITRTQTHQLRA